MTAILSAFPGELAALRRNLQFPADHRLLCGSAEVICSVGRLSRSGEAVDAGEKTVEEGEEVVTCCTGIGKLNAYLVTEAVVRRFRPSRILFIGIAGAVSSKLRINDIVISREIIQYDTEIWCRSVGWSKLPGPSADIQSTDSILAGALLSAAELMSDEGALNGNIFYGTTGTADKFMSPEIYPEYEALFSDRQVLSVDMEGFAAAAAAAGAGVSFSQVRIISDEADGTKPLNFRIFIAGASKLLAGLAARFAAADDSAE
jgi:5'-methylthioadenosine/S-adenosylhomocysteine nucleosidase